MLDSSRGKPAGGGALVQSSETVLHIDAADLTIPPDALLFRFSRSSGPGGQNVNRVATRVELVFDVTGSPILTDHQRAQVHEALASYIDKEGVLHLVSQRTRSQWRNRQDVLARFQFLLGQALSPRKERRPRRPLLVSKQRRMAEKRRRSEIKRNRGPVAADSE